ncbi:CHASE2 domain-containing protein [Poseidonocella sedimentorum]|uniref:Adenylate/guanylate cyclase n=1 Tax=Poseidonocella sedimentorum TaxID=871652 RepID=A0A1I6DPN4_9RHOB|nr:adenylate/guanylate cyclase domain-containing protein [Poseidonocella sedimentorum]SFR07337.1 adenylate/guanylate cyclase [Poseidonocella sedimentorum]
MPPLGPERRSWRALRGGVSVARLTAALGAALTLAAVLLCGAGWPLADRAREAVFDSYQRAAPRPYDPGAPVHVIDIDDRALALYGQWPWPRTYLAALADKLFAHGAVAVGFDMLFAEPDRTGRVERPGPDLSPAAPLPLPSPPPPDNDARLARAIAAGPSVLGLAGSSGPVEAGAPPRPKAGIAVTGETAGAALTRFPAALPLLPALGEAASGIGLISLGAGGDDTLRAVPMVADLGGVLVPAFSAELLRVAQGAGGYVLRTSEASGEGAGGAAVAAVALRVGAAEIPLLPDGQLRLYLAGHRDARLTSAADLLQAPAPDAAITPRLEGRIVLVGASATGLGDLRSTALGARVPGVIVHAEIIEQIAAGAFLRRPDWARGAEVAAILLAGLLVTLALVAGRPLLALGLLLGTAGAAIGGSLWAFAGARLLLDPLFPALTAVAIFLPGAALGFAAKDRARRRVRARFAYFLPPGLVDQIAEDPEASLTPQGAERELTVLFVDIRGFSALTEAMPPADVLRLVNTYLSAVSDALVATGATIDKFMGDAVMAFWNAPLPQPDHRARALGAIGALEDALARINDTLMAQGLPALDIAIGVNTGPASVGLMGSRDRLSYTCVGDSVTLAARLEGLTRLYGTRSCVGPESLAGMPDTLIAVELDRIAVKGRSAAQPVHAVLRRSPEAERLAQAVAEARAAYVARDWDGAEAAWRGLSAEALEGRPLAPLAAEYLARIARHRAAPPPADWDGSNRAQAKR